MRETRLRLGKNLVVGTFEIEALHCTRPKEPDTYEVDEQPADGDDENRKRNELYRIGQSDDPLIYGKGRYPE